MRLNCVTLEDHNYISRRVTITSDTSKCQERSKDCVNMYFMRNKGMCTQQAHQTKNFDGKKWQFFVIFDNFLKKVSCYRKSCLPLLQCFENEKKAKNVASSTKNIFVPRKKILILQHLVKW